MTRSSSLRRGGAGRRAMRGHQGSGSRETATGSSPRRRRRSASAASTASASRDDAGRRPRTAASTATLGSKEELIGASPVAGRSPTCRGRGPGRRHRATPAAAIVALPRRRPTATQPGGGCLMAAPAPRLHARAAGPLEAVTDASATVLDTIGGRCRAMTPRERRDDAIRLFASRRRRDGRARAADDPTISDEVLQDRARRNRPLVRINLRRRRRLL